MFYLLCYAWIILWSTHSWSWSGYRLKRAVRSWVRTGFRAARRESIIRAVRTTCNTFFLTCILTSCTKKKYLHVDQSQLCYAAVSAWHVCHSLSLFLSYFLSPCPSSNSVVNPHPSPLLSGSFFHSSFRFQLLPALHSFALVCTCTLAGECSRGEELQTHRKKRKKRARVMQMSTPKTNLKFVSHRFSRMFLCWFYHLCQIQSTFV